MYRFLLAAMMALITTACFAQKADSLFVSNAGDSWYIMHKVHAGETLFSLSRKYHVPPAMLAGANNTSYNGDLTGKPVMKIPIGAYNQVASSMNTSDARPVYYRVGNDDNLYRISKKAGVQQYRLQELNRMPGNSVHAGQALLIGYILYDATELPVVNNPRVPPAANKNNPVNTTAAPRTVIVNGQTITPAVQADTVQTTADSTVVSKGEELYLEQTRDGQNVVSEKGPAAFFPMSGGSNGVYMAFHNTVPKGTIVKVHNPGNGKDIYVKIIGQLPANKKFYNTVIGISNRARAELGTVEQRLWVELSYAGY